MPQSAQQKVATHNKRVRCVELAAEGMSYDEIAQTVGYSNRGSAHKAVTAALRAQQADAVNELRVLELNRLDALQRAFWDAALTGEISAVDRVLRIIQARVRILGLDHDRGASPTGGATLVSPAWRPDGDSVPSGASN